MHWYNLNIILAKAKCACKKPTLMANLFPIFGSIKLKWMIMTQLLDCCTYWKMVLVRMVRKWFELQCHANSPTFFCRFLSCNFWGLFFQWPYKFCRLLLAFRRHFNPELIYLKSSKVHGSCLFVLGKSIKLCNDVIKFPD